MEINVPGLVNTTVRRNGISTDGQQRRGTTNTTTSTSTSRSRGAHVVTTSQQGAPAFSDNGFLSLSNDFPRDPPRLYITAEDDEFDQQTLARWRAEGFDVEYVSMNSDSGVGGYRNVLNGLSKRPKANHNKKSNIMGPGLGPCELFGIVAYGEAASICLEHFYVLDNNPDFRLGLLIAYYPTRIPDPHARYPGGVNVLIHLPSQEPVGVTKQAQMLGIQGKRRTKQETVGSGNGPGGTLNFSGFKAYAYTDANPGFAESDLDDDYDRVPAELAWSRSLAAAQRAFSLDKNADPEAVVEENLDAKFYTRDLGRTMKTYAKGASPHATYVPTLTGGIGASELRRFYGDYFLDRSPPSLRLTLLSRTACADRVVDELHVEFRHTTEIPWMLPGMPPTDKRVEVVIVSIAALRGGRIESEHVYWDQASVLLQTGLLDRRAAIPAKWRDRGVQRLPIVGRDAAHRLLLGGFEDEEEDGEADNELLGDWYDDDVDEGQAGSGGSNKQKIASPEKAKPRSEGGANGKSKEDPASRGSGAAKAKEASADGVSKDRDIKKEPEKQDGEKNGNPDGDGEVDAKAVDKSEADSKEVENREVERGEAGNDKADSKEEFDVEEPADRKKEAEHEAPQAPNPESPNHEGEEVAGPVQVEGKSGDDPE